MKVSDLRLEQIIVGKTRIRSLTNPDKIGTITFRHDGDDYATWITWDGEKEESPGCFWGTKCECEVIEGTYAV